MRSSVAMESQHSLALPKHIPVELLYLITGGHIGDSSGCLVELVLDLLS